MSIRENRWGSLAGKPSAFLVAAGLLAAAGCLYTPNDRCSITARACR